MKYRMFISLTVVIIILLSSCTKWLELGAPKNQLTLDKVFRDSATAESAVLDIYAHMERSLSPNFVFPISLYGGELIYNGASEDYTEFAENAVLPDNQNNQSVWTAFYTIIYKCNDALENLSGDYGQWVDRFVAETRFLRAFSYFYLVNLYGNIPLVLHTDVTKSSKAFQVPSHVVYEQIIEDLDAALVLLAATPLQQEQVSRVSKDAVSALMARAFMIMEDWEQARDKAEEIVLSNHYSLLDYPEDVFKRGSKEAIFQLWTMEGFTSTTSRFVPANETATPQFLISESLYNVFHTKDERRKKWLETRGIIGAADSESYIFRTKYRNITANHEAPEDLMVLRLAELYLIKAEANLNLGNTEEALDDLNVVRMRSGLDALKIEKISLSALQDSIMVERQRELFTEWGLRFLDMKRVGQLQNLPIPQDELLYNPNLTPNSY